MMNKIVFTLFFFLFASFASASDGGKVEAGKQYDVPVGNFDIDYTTTEDIPEGQTVVVFYNTQKPLAFTPRNFAFGSSYKEFGYANEYDADRNLVVRFYDTKGIVKAGKPLLINLYSPLEEGAKWAYVICPETDKQTVADPFGSSGADTQDLPGQTEATAFELTTSSQFVTAAPSKNNPTEYVIYAKFTPATEGKVSFTLPNGEITRYIKAEGESFKTFSTENGVHVMPGVTYYVWYRYSGEVSGNIRYTLAPLAQGEARSTAFVVSGDSTFDLLGRPSIGKDYFYNTTTWFRLDKDALSDKLLMSIRLSGGNSGEVALFAEGVAEPVKAYAIGEGSGMLPINSTVEFDLDSSIQYYVAITQDNAGGVATFTFKEVEAGQTMGTALEAVLGSNAGKSGYWYSYTHTGDNIISITGVNTVYNRNGGLVATGSDVSMGFRMVDAESVYFQATGSFTIRATEVPVGFSPDMPVVLTLDKDGLGLFRFSLSGSDSDTRRYIQFTATESGTFMYGTDNSKVVEMALGTTVTDRTAGKAVSVVQQKQNFGTVYFTYTWQVTAGHTYLIEQTLVNNIGNVTFMASFTTAVQGEVMDYPINLQLAETYDLGRSQTLARYFRFTAEEDGNYFLSVHAQGYVRCYDEDGSSFSISRDYANGTDFHNETFALQAGESILFSVEPSADIEHLAGGVQDFFIPNYYASVTRDDAEGQTFSLPIRPSEGTMYDIDNTAVWYGPISVPAGESFEVVARNTKNNARAIVFFANEQGQWIDNESDILYDADASGHSYFLRAKNTDRTIYLMTCGFNTTGIWFWGDPETGICLKGQQAGESAGKQLFDLLGRRIASAHGVVIKDGKKLILK